MIMQTRLAAVAAFALVAAVCAPPRAFAQDTAGVRAAVLDYVEGFYEGDLTWPEFHAYANRVKARGGGAPPNASKHIEIFDVQDQTASAKLTARWGTDYHLLARYDGRWMITHVLWQSPPRQAMSPAR